MKDDSISVINLEHVTLDNVSIEVEGWRKNKASKKDAMPDTLWRKIFHLSQKHDIKVLCTLFKVSNKQYHHHYQRLVSGPEEATAPAPPATPPPLTLCRVQQPYEPEGLPAPNDLMVVEFYRQDGSLMKIHTTSEKVSALIDGFLGKNNAADDQ